MGGDCTALDRATIAREIERLVHPHRLVLRVGCTAHDGRELIVGVAGRAAADTRYAAATTT
jgi:hypothetical protein